MATDPQVAFCQNHDPRNYREYSTVTEINHFIKSVTGDDALRYHHLRHSWATRFYARIYSTSTQGSTEILAERSKAQGIRNTTTNLYQVDSRRNEQRSTQRAASADIYSASSQHELASNSVIENRWLNFIGRHESKYPLASIATALGHLHEGTTISSYIHSFDASLFHRSLLETLSLPSKAIAYSLQTSDANARQKIRRNTLYEPTKKIPVPQLCLKDRPESIGSYENLPRQVLSPYEIEQLLLRQRETRRSIEVVAQELFLDRKSSQEALEIAAKLERTTGFDFYSIELNQNHTLNLSDKGRTALYNKALQQKSYKQQNINILRVLNEKHTAINNLSHQDQKAIRTSFFTWARTLYKTQNTLTDQLMIEDLKILIALLFPELNSSQPSKQRPDRKKSCRKAASSYNIKISPGGQINTNQMLIRILFILTIYLQQRM